MAAADPPGRSPLSLPPAVPVASGGGNGGQGQRGDVHDDRPDGAPDAAAPTWADRVAQLLPRGHPLPDEVWRARHRFIVTLLAAHVPVIAVFAVWRGLEPWHIALEAGLPALLAAGAMVPRASRTLQATLASVGLLTCSAVLVHLSGGYIEMHFHFFVMMPIISLYHDWTPFLLAIGYVAVHHGVMGSIDPASVYNHPDAIAQPWKWALIHASFILGICAASVYNWRLSERALERQVASERQAAQFSGELLRVASHELNTPLTPLSLQLMMLASGDLGPLNDRQRRAVDVLERNLDRLSGLIREVLEASRLREGRLRVVAGPMDLAAVLAASGAMFQELAAKRGIAFEVVCPRPFPMVGDPHRLEQLVTNLLSNAFKFTPDGGRVRLVAAPDHGAVRLRVEDNGRGLEPAQAEQLFQPFSQVERTDGARGMGLGLYICRGIAEQHGGAIAVESAGLGQGATFTVTLPATAVPPHGPVVVAAAAPASGSVSRPAP